MNFITSAAEAKGTLVLLKRARRIASCYGLTPMRMDGALRQFAYILRQFDCGATFPITAVALKRNRNTIAEYLDQNIEFAVHGYTHVDYAQLPPEEQLDHMRFAREVFAGAGVVPVGFRSPYLRRDPHLYVAIETAGFSYASNQPVMWDALDVNALSPQARAAYRRAISYYAPWQAGERPVLPSLHDHLVEIPVSLPDDEILLDRLDGGDKGLVEEVWRRILAESYRRGELFTLQLHPERIAGCADALAAVLAEARSFTPPVWLARLDEIAAWWRARAGASVAVTEVEDGKYQLAVTGPDGTVVLARAVRADADTGPWVDGYKQVEATTLAVQAPCRPFIGLSPDASPELAGFLRQQGYIIEIGENSDSYSYYFDQAKFTAGEQRSLLDQIEGTNRPLVRLGRWPNGARSALAITGDIDALTLWDYGLRLFGK